MKITKMGEVIVETPDPNALTFGALPKGAIYRYRNGGENKVYMKFSDTQCMLLTGGAPRFFSALNELLVIHYPFATLDVGLEVGVFTPDLHVEEEDVPDEEDWLDDDWFDPLTSYHY